MVNSNEHQKMMTKIKILRKRGVSHKLIKLLINGETDTTSSYPGAATQINKAFKKVGFQCPPLVIN